jgi:hypothetical protein
MKPTDPDSKRNRDLIEQFADLVAEKLAARLTLMPPAETRVGEEFVSARTFATIYPGKNWRSLDSFARRNGIKKYRVGGTPCYRRADLDAAIVMTAKAPPPAPEKRVDDLDADYLRLVRGAK